MVGSGRGTGEWEGEWYGGARWWKSEEVVVAGETPSPTRPLAVCGRLVVSGRGSRTSALKFLVVVVVGGGVWRRGGDPYSGFLVVVVVSRRGGFPGSDPRNLFIIIVSFYGNCAIIECKLQPNMKN